MRIITVLLAMLSLSGFPQAIEPELVFVRGGTFRMGSNFGAQDEMPVHEVSLDDYFIGKYEVTQAEWDAIFPYDTNLCYFEGCDSCPAERESWNSVQRYIDRLNELTGKGYRLPTEAEWEYAARGGAFSKGYKYSGSNKADSVAWTDGNADNYVHPVGRKKPNELGIYDMSGNVFEWCSDWYDEKYYSISPSSNPQGPEAGTKKVIRGGSWFFDRAGIRVADRDKGNPEFRYGYVGFRLCLPAPDSL